MEHSFDINIAAEYGIHVAILLKNLHFWIVKNRANEKHYHEGKYWTYNSQKAFSELFPYLTERQVKYTIEKMKKDELIIVGNFNENPYDKTSWYALTDKAFELLGDEQKNGEKPENTDKTNLSNRIDKSVSIDKTKLSNGGDKIVSSYIDTDNKPDNKQKERNKKERKVEINSEYAQTEEQITFKKIDELPDKEIAVRISAIFKNKKIKGKPITREVLKVLLDRLEKFAQGDNSKAIEILDMSVARGYTDIYPINQYKQNKVLQTENYGAYNVSEYESWVNDNFENYLDNMSDKL